MRRKLAVTAAGLAVAVLAFGGYLWHRSRPVRMAPALTSSLEGPLPSGQELDPIAILHARGFSKILNEDMVRRQAGRLRMSMHRFDGVWPRRAIEGVYAVDTPVPLQPDAWGVAPYYLVKENGRYFALTERNFASVFGPVQGREEAITYLKTYSGLFIDRFAKLVTTSDMDPKPPEETQVDDIRGGFKVRLIYYTMVHQHCFFAIDGVLWQDGVLELETREIIEDLGPGIVF